MIGCELSGGLENQFFRYAIARVLIEKRKSHVRNEKLLINMSHYDAHGFRGSIDDFNIFTHQVCHKKRLEWTYGSFLQKTFLLIDMIVNKLVNKLSPKKSIGKKYVKWSRKYFAKIGLVQSYDPETENLYFPSLYVKRIFTYGSFEKYDYFKSIETILKDEFTPKHPCCEENKELYKIIKNSNSVCLAIRRGDFLSPENKDVFYVCDLDYYKKAINYIQQHVEAPVFIVFSNDIEWVKENLHIDGEVYFEHGNDPVWETFRLMYSCRHFIISNSTMHWWAQWRCENQNKIVVAPDRWYNTLPWKNHLMQDSFVKIKTGVKNPFEQ